MAGERPTGVTILGALSLLGAIVVGAGSVSLLSGGEGLVGAFAAGVALLMGVVALGLFVGARWAWWLAAFNYLSGIVSHGWTVVAALIHGVIGEVPGSVWMRLAFSALIFLYLFERTVKGHFELENYPNGKAIGFLLVPVLAVFGIQVLLGV